MGICGQRKRETRHRVALVRFSITIQAPGFIPGRFYYCIDILFRCRVSGHSWVFHWHRLPELGFWKRPRWMRNDPGVKAK